MPAVKLAGKVGISSVVDMARRFGITSPAAAVSCRSRWAPRIMKLMEHVSAFTVFPDDGIHIDPHMIRRVTTYDGALLEEAHPEVHDVISPEVARTMIAMLEEVVQFGTGMQAKELGRPAAGKTGTTNDFTDAWYIGFTPQLTAGVWVGIRRQANLARQKRNRRSSRAADLAGIHAEAALAGMPEVEFANVDAAGTRSARPRRPRRHARHRADRRRTRRAQGQDRPREAAPAAPPPNDHIRDIGGGSRSLTCMIAQVRRDDLSRLRAR